MDDKSCKVFIVGLRQKSKVTHHLKAFIARTEVETGHCLKVLRSNGGGEYTGGELGKYLKEKGIKHEITTPETPQYNGVAERMNHTLLNKVWVMLLDAELPELYWYNVLKYAALLHNVVPTRALGDMTPEEAWSGNKPDVSRLCVFSSQAFVHIPDMHCDKLAAKLLVCTFLGHAQNCKAYRLIHHPMQHFLESCDIIFDEGGLASRTSFECVVIKSDNAKTVDVEAGGINEDNAKAEDTGKAGGTSESEKEVEDMLTIAPKPPHFQLQPLQALTQSTQCMHRSVTTICATLSARTARKSALPSRPKWPRQMPQAIRAHTRKPWPALMLQSGKLLAKPNTAPLRA